MRGARVRWRPRPSRGRRWPPCSSSSPQPSSSLRPCGKARPPGSSSCALPSRMLKLRRLPCGRAQQPWSRRMLTWLVSWLLPIWRLRHREAHCSRRALPCGKARPPCSSSWTLHSEMPITLRAWQQSCSSRARPWNSSWQQPSRMPGTGRPRCSRRSRPWRLQLWRLQFWSGLS